MAAVGIGDPRAMSIVAVVQERALDAYNALPGVGKRYAGNDARIGVSDYKSVSRSVQRVVFSRDYSASNGNQYMNPCARVRFKTNSAKVTWFFDHTDLNTRSDAFNGVISFLVDGVEQATATVVYGASGEASAEVDMASSATRTWEMIMPYGASVDFLRVQLDPGAVLQSPDARPTKRLLVIGDSVTMGFVCSKTITGWPYLLGQALGCEVINMGYGSMTVDPSHVAEAASVSHDACIYLIGYNNFAAQTALATFKANYKTAVAAHRLASSAPLYAVSMIWTNNTDTLTPADYRSQQSSGITEIADSGITFIDGLTVTDNDTGSVGDGVHPNDTGATEMVTALAAVIGTI